MDKIYKLVEQSISELVSMGLEFKPYVTYESYDPSFGALFHAGENLVLILSVDMIRTEFFVLPKGNILFLIDVLQETDLTRYLNMLGSYLFYDAKQSILDKYDSVPDAVRIVLFVVLFIAYEPVCMALGCTIGNYMKGIRVRKVADINKKINK